ncbi:MAG: type IV pilus twitching motility protein PilT [Sandaracinaceae bacterium]
MEAIVTASADNAIPSGEILMRILKGSIAAAASDIHLRAGHAPIVRMEGTLRPLEHPALSARFIATSRDALARAAGFDEARLAARQGNFACEIEGVGRLRVHFYQQSGTPALVLRTIPSPIPDFAVLRVPPVLKRLVALERGMVVISGATGNGKSTTIASLLERVNQERSKHVVTIEEPIEFLFEEYRSTFSQREVGRDVDSVEEGLTGALREDPDWIFVGEIRTPKEFEIALSAAEAGHVVVSTLHSQDTARAVQRMIHFYPEEHQATVRERVADVLAAVIAQRLIPKRGTRERILACEVMMRTPTIQDCIRDASRFRGIIQALEAGAGEYGTQSFDQVLLSLVRDQLVTPESARAAATNPNDLVRTMKLGKRA